MESTIFICPTVFYSLFSVKKKDAVTGCPLSETLECTYCYVPHHYMDQQYL